jgi:hypothetical protein
MASDPSRIAFRQMMGVFVQYDKSMVVLKLAGARARKRAREGRCEGRKPFGHYEGEEMAVSASRRSGPRVWGSTALPGDSTTTAFRRGRGGRGTASSSTGS